MNDFRHQYCQPIPIRFIAVQILESVLDVFRGEVSCGVLHLLDVRHSMTNVPEVDDPLVPDRLEEAVVWSRRDCLEPEEVTILAGRECPEFAVVGRRVCDKESPSSQEFPLFFRIPSALPVPIRWALSLIHSCRLFGF